MQQDSQPLTSAAMQQWQVLWSDCHIASFADNGTCSLGMIKDAAIATKGDKIVWLGEKSQLPKQLPKLLIRHSLENHWLTPGLIDCHSHLVYAGNRAAEFAARLKGESYQTIAQRGGGINATVTATRSASKAELLQQALQRVKALEKEGVTHIEIKSGYGLNLDAERKQLQIAREVAALSHVDVTTTFLGAHTVPGDFRAGAEKYIDCICNTILPTLHREKLIDQVDGFCETIAFSPAQIERVFATAQSLGLPVKIHAEQLSHSGGARLAAKYHALSADHLEYINEDDVRALADSGTVAVLLPTACYFLGEKHYPPIDLLRQYNVPIAIATDCNPGSSPCSSLLLAANMGCVMFRLSPGEALNGVTRNAAFALGKQNSIGSLEIGKKADFAIWKVDHPNELVYHLGANKLVKVVKNGVLVLT